MYKTENTPVVSLKWIAIINQKKISSKLYMLGFIHIDFETDVHKGMPEQKQEKTVLIVMLLF